jgi:hypothetical protein
MVQGAWNEAMRRRAFLTFLGLIGAWSLVEAQEASRPVIGFLSSRLNPLAC